jgi:hypothetical protein
MVAFKVDLEASGVDEAAVGIADEAALPQCDAA